MSAGWADTALARLADARTCPVCESAALAGGCCARCGADLRGEHGAALWSASLAAADALRARHRVLSRVPRTAAAPQRPSAVVAAAPGPTGRPHAASVAVSTPGPANASAGASLQSVLATAGAGLFAVAAIVFTFFNPELADRAARSTIIALVTVAFLGGALLLARRRLQSSAEAVGGLGLVFVGLDVQAVAGSFGDDAASWSSAALAMAVAGGLLLLAGLRFRIRIWLWAALPTLAAVPAALGFAVQSALPAALLLAAAGATATGLLTLLPRFVDAFPRREQPHEPATAPDAAPTRGVLVPEVVVLTAVQLIAVVFAIARILFAHSEPMAIAAVLAALAVHAVLASPHAMPRVWAFGAGVLAVGAGAFAASGALSGAAGVMWGIAVVPAGAVLALVVGALVPLPRRTPRVPLSVGAGLAAGITSAPAVISGMLVAGALVRDAGARTPLGGGFAPGGPALGGETWPMIIALAVIAAGFAMFALCARARPAILPLRGQARVVTALYATAAVLCLASAQVLPRPVAIGVLLLAVAGCAAVLVSERARRGGGAAVRGVLTVSAHLALIVAVLIAWQDLELVPVAGAATIAVLAVVARTVRRGSRFLHVGAGFGYALVVFAVGLSLTGVGGVALLCLTASAGLLVAIVATFLPVVGARAWQTILVVATVPFATGIVQVVFERSGWTALSTGLMFVLAVSLLLTRRAGLTVVVRTLAAATLVPSLAVVVLCLGAQLLVQSGSPVVLPVVALLVALALPSGGLIRDLLVGRGRMASTADAARFAIEASALVTAAIAVLLALTREAAGLGTACLVFVIVGVGAALTSLLAGRRYGWWVAAVSFTGALWSLWALNGVELAEAYLLPPAVGAAAVAVLLTLRGRPATALFAAGLAGAVVPVLVLLIAGAADAVPWRAHALLASAWLLLAAAALAGRARRLRSLREATIVAASTAALAGTVQAVRWGTGLDASPVSGGAAGVLLLCVAFSAIAAFALVVAARMLRSTAARQLRRPRNGVGSADGTASPGTAEVIDRFALTRGVGVPAALALAVGVWPAIERDWFVIWGMWTLMLCWLAVMLHAARRGGSALPPVWVLFGIAFVTAVVAWSPRELRVEMFSLPLGLFLLAAGVRGMAASRADDGGMPVRQGPGSWPQVGGGSWLLLAPGLIVMTSASVVSTFTDPLTWRAILVMALALAAILVGAARRLAAPFVIGLVVLPIENVFVFSVQLGRGIESMPWWITLATMGAVLLIIAVAGERRQDGGGGVIARVRDLR
ncbi:SCO7613 C-terminal domain-containing membrane protein [Microbacterium sp. NPDC058342]|uniref:SCO7613 C-terminal domain-containing membrane protein n=1 Tax=Microbacterium sp. NPDC058342 TaxID=3346454 RepID=UPI0036524620